MLGWQGELQIKMEYSKKILIVEDEEPIRRLMGIYSERAGLKADLAENGMYAESFISAKRSANKSYPVIVTDLKMPGVDGIELIVNLKQWETEKSILKPVIYVLSGYHEKGFDSVRKMGVNQIYQKPTDMASLFQHIKKSYDMLRTVSEE